MSESVTPQGWGRARGYSHAIKSQGGYLAISGQIGWNEHEEFVSDGFLLQARQALENILRIVASAGGNPKQIARLTWYITDPVEYRNSAAELGAIYRELFKDHYPAMTLIVVAGLLEPRARVEIEATAIL